MERSQHLASKARTRGQLKVISKDKDGNVLSVYETSNYIVFNALEVVRDLLLGSLGGSALYRMGIGSGGYNAMGVRITPDDTWDAKDDLTAPIYSKPFDSVTTLVSGNSVAINMVCTFNSSDISAPPFAPTLEASEACIIFGSGSIGNLSGAAYRDALNDIMFSYRTFEKKSFAPSAGTTLEIHWTIFLEKV